MKHFILAVAVALTGCGSLDNKPATVVHEYESCKIFYVTTKPPVRAKKKLKKEEDK